MFMFPLENSARKRLMMSYDIDLGVVLYGRKSMFKLLFSDSYLYSYLSKI